MHIPGHTKNMRIPELTNMHIVNQNFRVDARANIRIYYCKDPGKDGANGDETPARASSRTIGYEILVYKTLKLMQILFLDS